MTFDDSTHKKCSKCGEVKERGEFYNVKSKKDGKDSHCIKCDKIKGATYREVNKDKIDEKNRKYREKNKDKIKVYSRKYYEENKDKVNERNRKYREENKGKIKVYRRKYREENKEKVKEINRKYQSEKRKTQITIAMLKTIGMKKIKIR